MAIGHHQAYNIYNNNNTKNQTWAIPGNNKLVLNYLVIYYNNNCIKQ